MCKSLAKATQHVGREVRIQSHSCCLLSGSVGTKPCKCHANHLAQGWGGVGFGDHRRPSLSLEAGVVVSLPQCAS